MKQFPDYDEVSKRFLQNADVPYRYKEGIYALPDTQSFFMMFARTDILNSLGLSVPNTWDDFLNVAIVLQRKNLQVSLPYTQIADVSTANGGIGTLNLYPTLLMQNNLPLYNSDLSATMLTNPEQIKLFSDWTKWYTKLKIPVVTEFYNRFRVGSTPIGIAPYTLYTQLKAAAPEIDGRWTLVQLPGTLQSNGSINRTSAGSGTGCVITKLSKHPENAWKFIKWWTSADTQLRYSEDIESFLGSLGRVATSNNEALLKMDWDVQMLQEIQEQMKQVKELPELPGGYYISRGIDQSFWNVIEQNQNPSDMLLKWGDIVNKEISRKKAEYD